MAESGGTTYLNCLVCNDYADTLEVGSDRKVHQFDGRCSRSRNGMFILCRRNEMLCLMLMPGLHNDSNTETILTIYNRIRENCRRFDESNKEGMLLHNSRFRHQIYHHRQELSIFHLSGLGMTEQEFERKLAIYNATGLRRYEAKFLQLNQTLVEAHNGLLSNLGDIQTTKNKLEDVQVDLGIQLFQMDRIQEQIKAALFDIAHSRYHPKASDCDITC